MVLLDTETPGTSREIYSEDADGETCNPGVASSSLTIGTLVYVPRHPISFSIVVDVRTPIFK